MGAHKENLAFNATSLKGYDVILGQAWFRKHNPSIKWRDGQTVLKRSGGDITLNPIGAAAPPVE